MYLDLNKIERINSKLLTWFRENKRDLIFRQEREPYKVWISEIMAQQTQIDTLIPYFTRFIETFPDLETLSQAKEEDVLRLWEGLGYYSRAKNLLKAAQKLKNSPFPTEYTEILKLPGVGPYTAGAIASICYNEKVPAIDGNVIRILSRIYNIQEDLNEIRNKKKLWNELKETMPACAGDYNESLMELGALICRPKNPSCLLCPVRKDCFAYNYGQIEQLPVKKKKIQKETIENIALILFKDDKPLYIKRENETLLKDLYGFPLFQKSERKKLDQFLEKLKIEHINSYGESIHHFTHLTWKTTVVTANINDIPKDFTNTPGSVATAFKKMLKKIKATG